MKKRLTQKEKEIYLKNPDQCPYCSSVDITGQYTDFDTISCSRLVECNEEDCGRKWVDVYELKNIEEI